MSTGCWERIERRGTVIAGSDAESVQGKRTMFQPNHALTSLPDISVMDGCVHGSIPTPEVDDARYYPAAT